ncbi:MAG: hypothetical protein AAGG51_19020 [Cyanobacteria bacterium P01_G01_bin.54]
MSASVFGIVAIVAGASLVCGGFLGFLFGVPRTLSYENQNENTSGSGVKANTNLEQISDWLTKILVGVGLTQIPAILAAIDKVTRTLAPDFSDPNISDLKPSSISFTLGLLVYFNICGFFLGYLWARLYLPRQFIKADSLDDLRHELRHELNEAKDEINEIAKVQQLVKRQLASPFPEEDPEKLRQAFQKLSKDARRSIFLDVQEVRAKTWELEKAKMERTIPIFQALVEAEPDYHRFHAELGFALKDQRESELRRAFAALNKAIELRGDWTEHGSWTTYYEFNRVLCRIMTDDNFKNNESSSTTFKKTIRQDLAVVVDGGVVKAEKLKNTQIPDWAQLNNESLTELLGQKLGQRVKVLIAIETPDLGDES